jgi:hypothetical protein
MIGWLNDLFGVKDLVMALEVLMHDWIWKFGSGLLLIIV